jgi:hypothetical protein
MNSERVLFIIEAYGADNRHWPAAERMAALTLIGQRPELNAALVEARALDDALMAAQMPVPATGALKARILAAVQSKRQSPWVRLAQFLGMPNARSSQAALQPLGVLCAASILGLMVGSTTLETGHEVAISADMVEMAVATAGDIGLEDLE